MKTIIIGSGNVATWFACKFKKAKIEVLQVYSPTYRHGREVAEVCGAEAVDRFALLRADADLYLFSIRDDAYAEAISEIPFRMPCAVITAGSVSQKVLAGQSERYGVLYPCQTISKNANLPEPEVPLCVEGCDEETTERLLALAKKLSDKTFRIDEAGRKKLHLAAVFASNFTNAMYGVGFDILQENNISPELIMPLLRNTLNKISLIPPWQAQTGPARRHDVKVMQQQLNELKDNRLKEIYRLISELIGNRTGM